MEENEARKKRRWPRLIAHLLIALWIFGGLGLYASRIAALVYRDHASAIERLRPGTEAQLQKLHERFTSLAKDR